MQDYGENLVDRHFPIMENPSVRALLFCPIKVSTKKRHFRKSCDKWQTYPNIILSSHQPEISQIVNAIEKQQILF